MPNDLSLIRTITDQLLSSGLEVWLAGGWAEELHGLIPPRAHHDIDLLLRADGFGELDEWLVQAPVSEIEAKRFSHKRAFEVDDTMVEVILVRRDLTTHFWGAHRYVWPSDTLDDPTRRPPLVAVSALQHYRTHRPPPGPPARHDGSTVS